MMCCSGGRTDLNRSFGYKVKVKWNGQEAGNLQKKSVYLKVRGIVSGFDYGFRNPDKKFPVHYQDFQNDPNLERVE